MDKPTIQYIVEEALASGITDILIVISNNKRAIEDHFDRSLQLEMNLIEHGKSELLKMVKDISFINIHYIRQKEPKGLGYAILCAKLLSVMSHSLCSLVMMLYIMIQILVSSN